MLPPESLSVPNPRRSQRGQRRHYSAFIAPISNISTSSNSPMPALSSLQSSSAGGIESVGISKIVAELADDVVDINMGESDDVGSESNDVDSESDDDVDGSGAVSMLETLSMSELAIPEIDNGELFLRLEVSPADEAIAHWSIDAGLQFPVRDSTVQQVVRDDVVL